MFSSRQGGRPLSGGLSKRGVERSAEAKYEPAVSSGRGRFYVQAVTKSDQL